MPSVRRGSRDRTGVSSGTGVGVMDFADGLRQGIIVSLFGLGWDPEEVLSLSAQDEEKDG